MSVEGHSDDTPLTSHDTSLFSLLILLVYVSKFNVHHILMTLSLKLVQENLGAVFEKGSRGVG